MYLIQILVELRISAADWWRMLSYLLVVTGIDPLEYWLALEQQAFYAKEIKVTYGFKLQINLSHLMGSLLKSKSILLPLKLHQHKFLSKFIWLFWKIAFPMEVKSYDLVTGALSN